MTETEIIEQMARAICKASGTDPDLLVPAVHATHPHEFPAWQDYDMEARAAYGVCADEIERLRDELIEIKNELTAGLDAGDSAIKIVLRIQLMVDAALAGEKPND